MKQTAVEWLIKKLEILNLNKEGNTENELFRQIEFEAKAMEKEQIIDAVNSQRQLGWGEKGTQYYNNNFQSK